MTWRKILPNLVTVSAMLAAFFSIVNSAEGHFELAAKLIMLCLILDGLDGNLARWIKGVTQFGAELDTFVDITAYGLAPAMLIHETVAKQFGFWGLMLVGWTVLSGALRLSRFRSDPTRGNYGYTGLPITVNASWVAMFSYISIMEPDFSLQSGPLAAFVWACSGIFLFLQVSNVRYSKPSKVPVLFAAGTALVCLLFFDDKLATAAAAAICAYSFFYGIVTPFLPRTKRVRIQTEDDEEPATRHS